MMKTMSSISSHLLNLWSFAPHQLPARPQKKKFLHQKRWCEKIQRWLSARLLWWKDLGMYPGFQLISIPPSPWQNNSSIEGPGFFMIKSVGKIPILILPQRVISRFFNFKDHVASYGRIALKPFLYIKEQWIDMSVTGETRSQNTIL